MREKAILYLLKNPSKYANAIGFTKLGGLHNNWIRDMVLAKEDKTLQAHRNSFKTTCVAIALAIIIILKPTDRTLFLRKTDDDIQEIIAQVKNILRHPVTKELVRIIWDIELELTTENVREVSTNLCTDTRGASQLVGMGIKASLTGKHYDNIFTDDIVNLKDRQSKADREATKTTYQELHNLKDLKTGRIYNTGTPWHKDDAFTLMPEPDTYDCYTTGIMTQEDIEAKKEELPPSLFSANYELKHIADEKVIFADANIGADPELVTNGKMHIDSAYEGEDYTALTILQRISGKYYILGKCWRKNVLDCYDDILKLYRKNLCIRLHSEDNGDKGMVARDLKQLGIRTRTYHEAQNKYIKIVTYLKKVWKDVYFVEGTDPEYIQQILDYNENADHDDAPDSASSIIREVYFRKDKEYIIP